MTASSKALLTQETSFFRYPDVFSNSRNAWFFPRYKAAGCGATRGYYAFWCAGCSTGEEPYSIAITVLETIPFPDAWEIEILATDISRQALHQAERGIYSGRSLANLSPLQLETHFKKSGEAWQAKRGFALDFVCPDESRAGRCTSAAWTASSA